MKLSCSICLERYNITSLKPVVGSCGHTLCLPCSKKVKKQCPTCRRASFSAPVPNFEILALLEKSDDDDDDNSGCCHKKFNAKMRKMEKKYSEMVKGIKDDFSAQIKEIKEQNATSSLHFESIFASIAVMNDNVGCIDTLNHNMNVLSGKFVRLKEEMRGTRKRDAESTQDDEDEPGPSNPSPTKQLKMEEDREIEIVHACYLCGTPYPKETSLRADGVSSECVNESCQYLNIVADLLEGNKWVVMECTGPIDPHFQQIPMDTTDKLLTCQVCGEISLYSDAADWVISKTSADGDFREIPSTSYHHPSYDQPSTSRVRPIRLKIMPIRYSPDTADTATYSSSNSSVRISTGESETGPSSSIQFEDVSSDDASPDGTGRSENSDAVMKCVHCEEPLPKNLPVREDGVSVRCPTSKHLNIVGTLKKGNRWMMMVCADVLNPHFTQVSVVRKPGDLQKCRLCKKSGKLLDASDRMALPLRPRE